jgi:hypothetical protein
MSNNLDTPPSPPGICFSAHSLEETVKKRVTFLRNIGKQARQLRYEPRLHYVKRANHFFLDQLSLANLRTYLRLGCGSWDFFRDVVFNRA